MCGFNSMSGRFLFLMRNEAEECIIKISYVRNKMDSED
jgi:hypothetical protein